MTTTNDHRVDAKEYTRDMLATMRSHLRQLEFDMLDDEGADAYENVEAWVLEVEHTSRHAADGLAPEESTILLTYGGPTVRLTYSHRYDAAELFHSWGQYGGNDLHRWDLLPDEVDTVAEWFETFAPHPANEGVYAR